MERAADDGNISPELKAQLQKRQGTIDVWPENWEAVQVWMRAQTQWRVGMAGVTGLDYAGVDVVLERMGVADKADCFDRLQVMEAVVLKEVNDGA
jgi:hypothetical protein